MPQERIVLQIEFENMCDVTSMLTNLLSSIQEIDSMDDARAVIDITQLLASALAEYVENNKSSDE